MTLKTPPKNSLNKFIRLSGVGVQMGISIYIASYFGKWLDNRYGFEKLFTLLLVFFAFIASLISLLQQLKRIEKDADK